MLASRNEQKATEPRDATHHRRSHRDARVRPSSGLSGCLSSAVCRLFHPACGMGAEITIPLMRTLSSTLLLLALLLALSGAGWAWWLGAAVLGLAIRPDMPWLVVLLGVSATS